MTEEMLEALLNGPEETDEETGDPIFSEEFTEAMWKDHLEIDSAYNEFGDVEPKLASCGDAHLLLRLSQLFPDKTRLLEAADHDIIYLGIEMDELAEIATMPLLIELSRCGLAGYTNDSFYLQR